MNNVQDVKKCPNCRRLKSGLIFYQIPQIVINFCQGTLLKLMQWEKQYFIWIGLLLIELPKLVVVGIILFKSFQCNIYVWYQMIASDSPHNSVFPFSYTMVTSQNPPSDYLRLSWPLTTIQMPHMSASKIVPLIIYYDPLLWTSIGIISAWEDNTKY